MAGTDAVQMGTRLEMEDILVVVAYFALIIAIGLYASCRAARGTVSGYFLAGRKMNFFMVGCSLFVSNIGSEHFIGLAGSGASSGIGVGAWEFNAILLLQLLGFVFIPVYLASKCYTMPEFLHKRFGGERIRVYLAMLSLFLYVLIKCSVDLFTGALFIQQSLGWDLYLSIFILIVVVGILTITGGLTAVIYTDTLQALLMIGGASVLTFMGFNKVGGFEGLWSKYPYAMTNYTVANETCHYTSRNWYQMLRKPSDPTMPWPGFILGQTPSSIWYWCSDQVIVQRALAAKSLSHAQGAAIMAGFMKILPLFIMVMPGMMARVLYPDEVACVDPERCWEICQSHAGCTNIAYPKLVLGVMGKGFRGLMMAVMIAALMSDLDSIFNSASSIFTIDIWKRIRKHATVKELMIVGRLFIVVMIGVAIAWVPVLQETHGGQIFMYIVEVGNYVAPPVACVYCIAILWPRCNEKGAFWGLMAGFATGMPRLILIFVYKGAKTCGSTDNRPWILASMHYMYFSIMLFWIVFTVTVLVSLCTEPPKYKYLYRTSFWTRHDRYDPAAVESGKVVVVWHGPINYRVSVVTDTQTDDRGLDDHHNRSNGESEIKDDADLISSGEFDLMPTEVTFDKEGTFELESSGVVKERQTMKEFLYSWFCGVGKHGADQENTAAVHWEDMLSDLDQSRAAKIFLSVMMVVILAAGVVLYCFWSLWNYNPEGDVWARLELGLWNITDYRY